MNCFTTPRWLAVTALLAIPLAAAAIDRLTTPAAARSSKAPRYRILLTSDRDGQTRAYSILPNGSRLTPLRPRGRPLEPVTVSGDGSVIAYRDSAGSSQSIYVSRADGTGFRRLVRHVGFAPEPVLSPDGASVAFAVDREIWTMGTDGGDRRHVASGSSPTDWSPDGRALLLVGTRGAVIVQPLGGRRRILGRGGIAGCCYAPKWSPNGRLIAYGVSGGNRQQNGLWLVRRNGTRRRVASKAGRFAWSPDGRRLAFTVGDRNHDVSDVAVVGVKRRMIRRMHLGLSWGQVPMLAWLPGGRRLILTGHLGNDPEQVWMVGRDGRGLRRVTNSGTNSVLGWTRLAPVLPPASPLPPTERVSGAHTVATSTPITDLSAAGRRVAFVPESTATDCDHIAVWTPGKEAIRRLSPGLPAPCLERGGGAIYGVALAGARIAWAEILGCGNSCDVALESTALAAPRANDVSVLYGAFSADGGDPWDFHQRGEGNLLVFNDGSRLVRIGGGHEDCEGDTSQGGICTTLRRGSHAAPVDSVSQGLIAIRETDEVALVDAQGTLVRTFPFTPNDVSAAPLDSGHLVVARFAFLEEYDVATGVRELSRPLPAGYTLSDFDENTGIALLRRPKTIMLLRLADGATRTLRLKHGPVLAALEAPGLYYSYAAGKRGRLVFVPRSNLLQQLQ
jgi:Tol biopolymer transport system component